MANSILGANPVNNVAFDANLAQQFKHFQSSFNGNPKAQIDNMLRSGQISQQQLNQAIEAAKQLNNSLKLV